jgi:hypothetical protein
MSDNLDKRMENAVPNSTRVEYKIPNIVAYIIAFTKTYEEYCNTSLPLIEIMDKVGEKLGIVNPFTEKFSDYLLGESILNEIRNISTEQMKQLLKLAKDDVLSVIKDYNEGKCIEKGKEEDILSEYLYKFIKSEISKAPEGLFYRRIY